MIIEQGRSKVIRWVETALLRGSQFTDGAPWPIQVTEQNIEKLKRAEVGDDWLILKGAALTMGVSQQKVLQRLKSEPLEGVRVCSGRCSAWKIHVPQTFTALNKFYSEEIL